MDVWVLKAAIRTLAAFFVAFFSTIQLGMTGCRIAPEASWSRWICEAHPIASRLVAFACLFSLVLLLLSKRLAGLRRLFAVLLLVGYALYAGFQALEYRLWWYGVVPLATLAAGIGVGLRARWGTLLIYALSGLFLIYWLWGVGTAAEMGVFQSVPPLQAVLMLVPGIVFLLAAGFCCYAARPRATANA